MPDIFDEIEYEQSPVFGSRTSAPMPQGDIFDTLDAEEFMGMEGTKPIDDATLARLSQIKGPTEGAIGFEPTKEVYEDMGAEYGPMPIGEMATKVRHTFQPVPALGYASLKKGMGGLAQAVGAKATGKQWAEEADLVRQQIEKEHPLEPGGVGETVRAAAANIYAQAPSLALGLFNPALGLASFGLPAAGESFHELEKAGFGAAVKYPVAITKGVAEVATEMIPFGVLFKKGIGPGKRMLQLYVSELFGENINTTINAALDKVTLRPDMTMDDYIDDLKQTTKQTLAQVTMMGAGAAGIHRVIEGKKPPMGEPTAPVEAVSPEVAPDTMPEVEAQPTEAKKDIFDEISPEEAPSLDELAAEFAEPEKKLQPSEKGDIFNIEESKRRFGDGTYTHDRIPQEARAGEAGTPLEAAQEVARGSLRTVSPDNARDFSHIKEHHKRRFAAKEVRQAESDALRGWATQNNRIIEDFEGRHFKESQQEGLPIGGTDNFVMFDKERGRWLKANRFYFAPTMSDLFDRISLHNTFFPETRYEMEGFADTYGELLPIFSQADIKADPGVSAEQRMDMGAKELESYGFERQDDPNHPGDVAQAKFVKGDVIVEDIHAGNVIVSNGVPYIFDPVIYLNPETKSQRVVGEKIVAPVVEQEEQEEGGIDFGDIFDEIEAEEKAAAELAPKVVDKKPTILETLVKPLQSEAGQITIGSDPAPRPEGKAGEVYDDLMEARETSLQKKKTTIKQTFKKLKTSLVDVAGNTKAALNKLGPEGKKAVMRHIAHGGANAKALRIADKVTKDIYGELTNAEHDHLDQYIYAKRHLEIAENRPGFKMPGGRTVEHMQALIDSIPKEILTKVEKRAKTYWKTMDEQLTELRKEGLLTEAQLKGLRAVGRYYSPRVVLDYVDPERTSFEGGKKITIPDSGIKKLSDEGSEKLVEGDSSLLLTQVINRTQSRIFKNRANQALWELAEAQPDNPMVRKVKTTKPTKEGKPVYQAAPRGWEKISVMIDGQQKQLMMPEEFAGEWIFKDPILLHSQRNAIQWMTGTKILKAMATGLNPEFAFTNVPRDLALIWMSTEEYSPSLPKAMAQMGLDISGVLKDAVTRKGAFDDYVNEGGGMEFLTHQGRFTPKIHGHLGKIQNVMGYLGETSEIMTRLALRARAIKNGATPEEATTIARNYLDFTQGGNLAKAADSALPYLNAGIQATRGIVRAGATNPKLLSVKVAQVGGLATMLYMANRLLNEDAWDEIPDRDKVNNWIITTPYSYHDKTGTKRYIYFKIAKDQGQRVFASIFEAAAAKLIGDEVDTDQVMLAVRDFIPFAPTNLPPAVEAMLGYSANKDFWFNEDIWRGPKIRPEEEYTRYTPEAFKRIGKATGLSPERLKNSMQQFFTYGNIWTSLVGGGTQALLKGLDEKDKDLVTEEVILKQPFIRKMVRSTDPYYKYGKEIEESGIDVRTEKYKITRDFDNYAQKYFDDKISNEKVIDYIKKQPMLERKRLMRRFGTHKRLKDIPDRRFWVELLQEPPETRAYIYWSRLNMADAKEKDMLEKTSRKILGFRGKTFFYHLNKLKKGAK